MTARRARGNALLEVVAGVVAAALGVGALHAAADTIAPAEAAPAPSPPAPHAVQSLRPDAPPREVGPRYDSDAALPAHAEDIASYDIHARLDAPSRTITASSTIRWHNASDLPAHELWLHLYMNAFKNDRTVFLRSPFGAGRSGDKATDWGYVDVKKLAIRELGGADLWPGADKHSPGDADDQTDIRVPLVQPIAPDQTVTIDVTWSERLPEIVERSGYAGSFIMAGQWFPKLARREPDGTWVHFTFDAKSEFYADYGRYSVTLDVPASMVVGATGVRTSSKTTGDRRVDRYDVDSVHDFAWTAWDQFRERRERIDGVDVRLLYPPGNEHNADIELDALRFALPYFGRLFGKYPYPVLTVVHPPDFARNAGGMEYPTLITTGGPWYADFLGVRAVQDVTIHELGHQWFYGLVGTDEHAWPFLDEGLNTFAEACAMQAHYGDGSLVSLPGIQLSDEALRRSIAIAYGQDQVVALPAAQFASFTHMGALVYARTGTIMQTLSGVYGKDRVLRALGRYARRYRFEHPGPRHFIGVMREVLGDDAAANLERALFDRGRVDYVARDVESARVEAPAGVFDGKNGRQVVPAAPRGSAARWVGRALVFRHGDLAFPVDIDLISDDGERTRRRWDGREQWTSVDYAGSSPLRAAIVDPDRRVLLDQNLFDNARRADRTRPIRLLERLVYAGQLLLGALGP